MRLHLSLSILALSSLGATLPTEDLLIQTTAVARPSERHPARATTDDTPASHTATSTGGSQPAVSTGGSRTGSNTGGTRAVTTKTSAQTTGPTGTRTQSSNQSQTSVSSKTQTPLPTSSPTSSKSLSGGAIAGITVGVVVAVALIILVIGWWAWRHKKRSRELHGATGGMAQMSGGLRAHPEASIPEKSGPEVGSSASSTGQETGPEAGSQAPGAQRAGSQECSPAAARLATPQELPAGQTRSPPMSSLGQMPLHINDGHSVGRASSEAEQSPKGTTELPG